MVSHSNTAIERAMRNLPRLGVGWCREGESIPTVLKGIVKIPPIQANCNIGTGLRVVLRRNSKSAWGQFPVIWGDFGRRFTRKS